MRIQQLKKISFQHKRKYEIEHCSVQFFNKVFKFIFKKTFIQKNIKMEPPTQAQDNSSLTPTIPLVKHSSEKPVYLFETETRNLKTYYSDHCNQLMNRRIIFNNSVGTVKYIGGLKHEGKPANSEKQLWIGLQWDDQTRGKHNGTVNGCKYFDCCGTSGSMVKFQKIQFGYKLQTALFRRYFKAEQLHHAKDIFQSMKQFKKQMIQNKQQITEEKKRDATGKRIQKIQYDSEAYMETLKKDKRIMVEFVGFDEIWSKINNLDKIQSISLAECKICDLGPKGHLSSILTNLRILSMQDNLISDWNQVFQLGLQLPLLSQLSLTNNKISPLAQDIENIHQIIIPQHQQKYNVKQAKDIFPNLKSLVLINTGLTWTTLFNATASFENSLEELILCKNDLSDIQSMNQEKIKRFKKLNFLNMEETHQTNFDGVRKFQTLPMLEKLILNNNPIQKIGKFQGFKNLKHLSVQLCNIIDPIVIYQISQFKDLESLNIKHNPIGDRLGNSYVRMRSVAEISKLNIINGALLKKYDRKDCEIFYLRESFREYFAFKKVPDYDYDYQDFLKYCEIHHPNIPYFVKKYGNPYEVEQKKQIKQIIKDEVQQNIIKKGTGLIQILIKNKELDTIERKKVPLSWTISNLKNFFAKVHKIPVGMQKLEIQTDENSVPEQITEDHKNLGFYSVKGGSSIIVSRKLAS